MKTSTLFTLLFFSFLGTAQFVEKNQYEIFSPSISNAIDPVMKIELEKPKFIYNDDNMDKVSFYQEFYENGQLVTSEGLNLPEDIHYDEMYSVYSIYNKSSRYLEQYSDSKEIIKVDTIAYSPEKTEIIYYSDHDYLLADSYNSVAVLNAIYFKNNGQIIGKKSSNDFVKFSYDEKGNITESLGYRSLNFVDGNDNIEYLFSSEPNEYIRTAYDQKNRIKTQWRSTDESMLPDAVLGIDDYDDTHLLSLTEYSYNHRNQITSIKSTSFQLKKDWKSYEDAFLESVATGTAHPNIEKLTPLLNGKNETISEYTYDENARVIHRTENTVLWKENADSLAMTSQYQSADTSYQFDKNKVIEEDYSVYSYDSVETDTIQLFVKTISYLDQKGALIKREYYEKDSKEASYSIVFKEILEFDYK